MPEIEEFIPQPQETPLTDKSQQALTELLQVRATNKRLQKRLDNAIKKLTETAGQLNDRASEQRILHEKRRRRFEQNGEEIDEEEQDEVQSFQSKVADLTKKMDKGIRDVIDSRVWLDEVPAALQHVSSTIRAVEANQQPSYSSNRQIRPNMGSGTRGEDEEEEDADDEDGAMEDQTVQLDPACAPSVLLQERLSSRNTAWTSQTLTERYSENNDYTGFYRTVFDAQNPGDDAPAVPHASLWFAEEEGRESAPATQGHGGSAGDEEDSDLEVASERVRIKCPLTLLPFKDPWKSKKCPHSFEKSAIISMIDGSTDYLPFTPEQRQQIDVISARRHDLRAAKMKELGTPQVGCPECAVKLTREDLEPNPILLRKVKRQLEAERREREAEEEEDDEEDDLPRGTQRRAVVLGSSPPRRTSMKREDVKSEKAKRGTAGPHPLSRRSETVEGSVVDLRNSGPHQLSRRSETVEATPVVDLRDSDDEDETMNDE